jgi:molecular chaperone DnaK (HSP70)
MKTTAEQYMGRPVEGCVISEPTSFDASQTASLISASKAAGFKQVFTIKEPIAAALAFQEASTKIDKKVLVLDFGGHNFNVSLLSSNKGVYTIMATEDDFKLGGVHLDDILVDMVAGEFMRKTKMDLKENRRSVMKVKVACEQTKRALSQRDMAPCSIESIHEGMDFSTSINRSRFELLAEPLFQRCALLVKKTLEKNKLSSSDLDSVCFIFSSNS